jgi:UDP-N-acetylmuramate dehydrogenase
MTPQSDVPLAAFCTMGVGGPARWFADARTESDVTDALVWARERAVPVHVLGGGSNVIISDQGFAGLVLHVNIRGIERERDSSRDNFSAGAGEPWDEFVAATVEANCAGLECLSGIPGYVGGTPVQNVGAYGQDVSGAIARVRAIDRLSQHVRTFSDLECGFGYRTSRFKIDDANRYVVTRVEFTLTPDGEPTVQYADLIHYFSERGAARPSLSDVRYATLAVRRRKGMVIEEGNPANRSCGSFFVNPIVNVSDWARVQMLIGMDVPRYVVDRESVKIPAAWLIERAGYSKGTVRGPVGVSPFQSQAIINLGGASADDVLELAGEIKQAVWATFGISLVPEPVFVGFTPSPKLRLLLSHQRSH